MGELREFPRERISRNVDTKRNKEADVLDFKRKTEERKIEQDTDIYSEIFENERTEFLRLENKSDSPIAVFFDTWMNQEFGLNREDCIAIRTQAVKKGNIKLSSIMDDVLEKMENKEKRS